MKLYPHQDKTMNSPATGSVSRNQEKNSTEIRKSKRTAENQPESDFPSLVMSQSRSRISKKSQGSKVEDRRRSEKSERKKMLLGKSAVSRPEMPLELNPVEFPEKKSEISSQEFARQLTLQDPFLTMKNTGSSTT
jgi:hypothetical protein